MNKREHRKQVEEVLRANIVVCPVWQERPNTAVSLVVRYNGEDYQAYGWAKVQYPDEWNEKYGVELVMDKAIAKISKRITDNEQHEGL